MSLVNDAITAGGGLQAVAEYCGVKYQAVQKWRKRLPPDRAAALEKLTKGQYTRRMLCPDFPWDEEAPSPTSSELDGLEAADAPPATPAPVEASHA